MNRMPIRNLLYAAMFTALTAVGAFIRIPIPPYPVPMTLQTLFLYLAGLLLPRREAFLSQAAYVLLGLIGVPIFVNGGGIGYILDPTFGYLVAFLLCAPLLSEWAGRTLYAGKRAAFAAGGFAIVAGVQILGVAYMSLISVFYLHTPLPFSRVLYLAGIFLPLDLFKLGGAAMLALQLRHRLPNALPAERHPKAFRE